MGAAKRKRLPRAGLGHWDPKLRRHDPLKVLAAAMRGRIPALVQLKTERMCTSPFAFFRGAVPVMAADLSLVANTGILSQLCGDAHVQNLGAYEGSDGRLIFDINDFDETIRGPFEWDIKRMATSILLAGREAKIKEGACVVATERFLERYHCLMRDLAGMPVLEMARYQVHRLSTTRILEAIFQQAERATPLHSFEKLTTLSKRDGRIFRSNPPLLERVLGARRREILASLSTYVRSLLPERQHFFAQFRPIDVAFKVVGTGSVGLRDFCIYMEGNGSEDPLFLQIKEEVASGYARYVARRDARYTHQGERAAHGQRALQLQSDPFLGWTRISHRDYLVRQLNDHKATLDITTLSETDLAEYAAVCGELLARGHARSGDPQMIVGYVGNSGRFNRALLSFARAYADQTVQDWKALRREHRAM